MAENKNDSRKKFEQARSGLVQNIEQRKALLNQQRLEMGAIARQNQTIKQAADIAAQTTGQQELGASTEATLRKYGRPSVSKKSEIITKNPNIIVNNTVTNYNGGVGPTPGRPLVVKSPGQKDSGIAKFKAWLSGVFAKQAEDNSKREREFIKQDGYLSRTSSKLMKRLETFGSSIAEQMNPKRIAAAMGSQMKTLLFLFGAFFLAANWTKILDGIGKITDSIKRVADYFTGKNNETPKFIVTITKLLGGNEKDGVIGSFRNLFSATTDAIKDFFKKEWEIRSEAVRQVKMPTLADTKGDFIGILSRIGDYLVDVLTCLTTGSKGVSKSISRTIRTGVDTATNEKTATGAWVNNRSKYTNRYKYNVWLGDAASAMGGNTMISGDVENNYLTNNTGASVRQAKNISALIRDNKKANVAGVMTGMERLKNTAVRKGSVVVPGDFFNSFSYLGVPASSLESLTRNSKVGKYKYVIAEKTEDDYNLEGLATGKNLVNDMLRNKVYDMAGMGFIDRGVANLTGLGRGYSKTEKSLAYTGIGLPIAVASNWIRNRNPVVQGILTEGIDKKLTSSQVLKMVPIDDPRPAQEINTPNGKRTVFEMLEISPNQIKDLENLIRSRTGNKDFEFSTNSEGSMVSLGRAIQDSLSRRGYKNVSLDYEVSAYDKMRELENFEKNANKEYREKHFGENTVLGRTGEAWSELGSDVKNFGTGIYNDVSGYVNTWVGAGKNYWNNGGKFSAPSAPSARISSNNARNNGLYVINALMRELGLTREQAAGVVGVLNTESGLDPRSYNRKEKNGTYYSSGANNRGGKYGTKNSPWAYGAGLCQWTFTDFKEKSIMGGLGVSRERARQIIQGGGIESLSLEDQTKMLIYNLKSSPALEGLKKSGSASQAAATYYCHFIAGQSNSREPATMDEVERVERRYKSVGANSIVRKAMSFSEGFVNLIGGTSIASTTPSSLGNSIALPQTTTSAPTSYGVQIPTATSTGMSNYSGIYTYGETSRYEGLSTYGEEFGTSFFGAPSTSSTGAISPIGSGNIVITSGFGKRISPGGIGSTNHNGIDIRINNAPVYATEDNGVISAVGDTGNKGYGKFIKVRYNREDGTVIETVYGHLSSINVRLGQTVVAGDVIGISGNSGSSTGPHLHFEVALVDGKGNKTRVDPVEYLASIAQTGGVIGSVSMKNGELLFGGNLAGEPTNNQTIAGETASTNSEKVGEVAGGGAWKNASDLLEITAVMTQRAASGKKYSESEITELKNMWKELWTSGEAEKIIGRTFSEEEKKEILTQLDEALKNSSTFSEKAKKHAESMPETSKTDTNAATQQVSDKSSKEEETKKESWEIEMDKWKEDSKGVWEEIKASSIRNSELGLDLYDSVRSKETDRLTKLRSLVGAENWSKLREHQLGGLEEIIKRNYKKISASDKNLGTKVLETYQEALRNPYSNAIEKLEGELYKVSKSGGFDLGELRNFRLESVNFVNENLKSSLTPNSKSLVELNDEGLSGDIKAWSETGEGTIQNYNLGYKVLGFDDNKDLRAPTVIQNYGNFKEPSKDPTYISAEKAKKDYEALRAAKKKGTNATVEEREKILENFKERLDPNKMLVDFYVLDRTTLTNGYSTDLQKVYTYLEKLKEIKEETSKKHTPEEYEEIKSKLQILDGGSEGTFIKQISKNISQSEITKRSNQTARDSFLKKAENCSKKADTAKEGTTLREVLAYIKNSEYLEGKSGNLSFWDRVTASLASSGGSSIGASYGPSYGEAVESIKDSRKLAGAFKEGGLVALNSKVAKRASYLESKVRNCRDNRWSNVLDSFLDLKGVLDLAYKCSENWTSYKGIKYNVHNEWWYYQHRDEIIALASPGLKDSYIANSRPWKELFELTDILVDASEYIKKAKNNEQFDLLKDLGVDDETIENAKKEGREDMLLGSFLEAKNGKVGETEKTLGETLFENNEKTQLLKSLDIYDKDGIKSVIEVDKKTGYANMDSVLRQKLLSGEIDEAGRMKFTLPTGAHAGEEVWLTGEDYGKYVNGTEEDKAGIYQKWIDSIKDKHQGYNKSAFKLQVTDSSGNPVDARVIKLNGNDMVPILDEDYPEFLKILNDSSCYSSTGEITPEGMSRINKLLDNYDSKILGSLQYYTKDENGNWILEKDRAVATSGDYVFKVGRTGTPSDENPLLAQQTTTQTNNYANWDWTGGGNKKEKVDEKDVKAQAVKFGYGELLEQLEKQAKEYNDPTKENVKNINESVKKISSDLVTTITNQEARLKWLENQNTEIIFALSKTPAWQPEGQ